MRFFLFVSASVMAAASCAPTPVAKQTTAGAGGCSVAVQTSWQPQGAVAFSIEGVSQGPDCARAAAMVVVRDAGGAILWSAAYPAEQVMTLAQAHDVAAMQSALAEWIASDNHAMVTTSALPEWPEGASGPENGEFPFYPESDLDRNAYNALRARNAPMFSYVQGMESMTYLALENGTLTKVGVQTFPG